MKLSLLASTLLASSALGVKINLRSYRRRADAATKYPEVPAYKFPMLVDHFDASNKKTYSNRYFVNDTYYQPGGPVILFDFGESGASPDYVADYLAEFTVTSAPMRLAEKLNGLVVGWEHRYYGYSRPVPMDDTSGLPMDGASGYKYLTADQALEDVAYFANNFNQTKLAQNKIIESTEKLDPYHTPWIFVGGSYPGMRAAWMRLKHPEVIYASWSSSAPVETQTDGSIYYNPIVRSIPQNCTNDIEAAIKYVDDTLTSGSQRDIRTIYAGTYLATNDYATYDTLDEAFQSTPYDLGSNLTYALSFDSFFQSFGPTHTTQFFCDAMESFNVKTFIKGYDKAKTVADRTSVVFANRGDSKPSKDGIAASNGDNGNALAFAAMLYGITNGKTAFNKWYETVPGGSDSTFTETVDGQSWSWQTVDEMGFYQASNTSLKPHVISKYYNVTAYHDIDLEGNTFSTFASSSFPPTLNDSYLLALGGWDMKASNVMFTNGEFDPWRSFSVASQETTSGASNRNITKKVPACNQVVNGTDVFGLVYAGAVHVEDLSVASYEKGSIEKKTPMDQGLDLFLEAWDTWVPCFNQSRDDIRNNKGVDGKGHKADGSSDKSAAERPVSFSTLSLVMCAIWAMAFIM